MVHKYPGSAIDCNNTGGNLIKMTVFSTVKAEAVENNCKHGNKSHLQEQ